MQDRIYAGKSKVSATTFELSRALKMDIFAVNSSIRIVLRASLGVDCRCVLLNDRAVTKAQVNKTPDFGAINLFPQAIMTDISNAHIKIRRRLL
jgi:hypothetical protein